MGVPGGEVSGAVYNERMTCERCGGSGRARSGADCVYCGGVGTVNGRSDFGSEDVRRPRAAMARASVAEPERAMGRAAWYADPYGSPGRQRWWDGKKWTKELRDTPSAGSLPVAPLRPGPRRDGIEAAPFRRPPGVGGGKRQDEPRDQHRWPAPRIDAAIDATNVDEQAPRDRPHYLRVGAGGVVLGLSYSLEDRAWKLDHDVQRVGLIGLSSGYLSGAAGAWGVVSDGRARVLFDPRQPAGGRAAFSPRRLSAGGTLTFSDDSCYSLGQRPFSDGWHLVAGDGDALLLIRRRRAWSRTQPPSFTVEVRPGYQPEALRLLATLASCYVLLSYAPWGNVRWAA